MTDERVNSNKYREGSRQTDRQTDRQAGRQADRQTRQENEAMFKAMLDESRQDKRMKRCTASTQNTLACAKTSQHSSSQHSTLVPLKLTPRQNL